MLPRSEVSAVEAELRVRRGGHNRAENVFPVCLLLVTLAGIRLPAQTFSLVSGREPVTSLDGLWRFHTGDNPAWADPSLDDSNWPLVRSDESWTKQGYFAYSGYAWYRFAIQVVDGSKPVGLLLPRIYTGYQVYANGKLIGGSGSIIPTVAPALAANPKLFRFHPGDAGPQTVQIAIRVWEYRPIVSWVGGGTLRAGSAAGDPELLEQRLHWIVAEQQSLLVNSYAYGFLATVVGLTILTLFLLHREDREYLWFSMLLLAGAADAMLNVQGFSDAYPFLLFRLTDEVLVAISALAALLFFSTVLKTHRPAERKTAKTAVTTKFLRRIVCSKNEDTPKIGAWFRRKSGNAASFFGSILYSRYIPAVSWPIGK